MVAGDTGAEGLAIDASFQSTVETLPLLDEVVMGLITEMADSIGKIKPLCLVTLVALLQ